MHRYLKEHIQSSTHYLPLRPDFISVFSVSWSGTTFLSTQVSNVKLVSHPSDPTTHQGLPTLHLIYFVSHTSPVHLTSALVQNLRISQQLRLLQ